MFAWLTSIAGAEATYINAALIVAGVVTGSALWWFTLTTVVSLLHARIDEKVMRVINHGSGIAVTVFGLAILVRLAVLQFR